MPWARIDDQFHNNPKIRKCSSSAIALYVCSISYCSANLTDGFVGHSEVVLVSSVRKLKPAIDRLIAVGLWKEVEGGWQIPDYLEYNPSKEEVLARRQKDREKKATQRRGPDGKFDNYIGGVPQGVPRGVPEGQKTLSPGESDRPDPAPTPIDITTTKHLPERHGQRFDVVFEILAKRAFEQSKAVIANPDGWKRKVASEKRAQFGELASALKAANPTWTPEQIADELEPPPKPTALEVTAIAQRKLMEKNALPPCAVCESTGWVFNDDDQTEPCRSCERTMVSS